LTITRRSLPVEAVEGVLVKVNMSAVTTQVLDQDTFALCQAQCSTLYRADGSALIGVNALRFGDSDRIATAVLQRISSRVPDA
jgi:hypothetical protein